MIWAVLGAALVGVSLGLLGSGGSILTVPTLVYLVGRPEKNAVVESLAIVGVIALSGALTRLRKRELDLSAAALFAVASVPGSLAGTWLGARMPGALQLVILGLTMLTAAALMLRKGRADASQDRAKDERRRPGLVLPVGAGVGLLTGVVGIGGGFLFVPALTVAAGLEIRRAIGTSLCLIAINCATGLTGYLAQSERLPEPVDWVTVGVFAAVGVAGAMAGQRLGGRLSRGTLKRLFAAFLIVIGVFMLWRETAALLESQRPSSVVPATD